MDPNIRDQFPAALNSTYLNSAAMAPLPTVAVQAVTEQLQDVSNNGAANIADWFRTRSRVRGQVAAMLGVRSDEIAFMRNTSDGLCAAASGLKWEKGDNIVTFESEFPANYYPWRKVHEDHGVELRLCGESNGRIDIDELCGLIDGRTRLVAVSAVQYSSGYRLDLERVGKAARKRDALFAVDIIQALGAMPIDLPAQYVDIAAGASYKWLCSPEGCGIFYLNERARGRISPTSRGWSSVDDPWNFANREQELVSDSRCWETGMGGSALLYGLEQSLSLICESGIEKIAAYLAELTDFLCEIIPFDRYEIASSRARGEKSQIVCIRPLDGNSPAAIVERLARENVVTSARGDLVRIAPHFFNNFADIERVAACLP